MARTVAELRGDGQPLDGIAVLYRTNAQSRVLEDAFRVAGLPYHIVGSVRFYERREIKDALAYLRLVTNPADDLAFRRALGAPPRGIGRDDARPPRGARGGRRRAAAGHGGARAARSSGAGPAARSGNSCA